MEGRLVKRATQKAVELRVYLNKSRNKRISWPLHCELLNLKANQYFRSMHRSPWTAGGMVIRQALLLLQWMIKCSFRTSTVTACVHNETSRVRIWKTRDYTGKLTAASHERTAAVVTAEIISSISISRLIKTNVRENPRSAYSWRQCHKTLDFAFIKDVYVMSVVCFSSSSSISESDVRV
jgi:hypothetical protein